MHGSLFPMRWLGPRGKRSLTLGGDCCWGRAEEDAEHRKQHATVPSRLEVHGLEALEQLGVQALDAGCLAAGDMGCAYALSARALRCMYVMDMWL